MAQDVTRRHESLSHNNVRANGDVAVNPLYKYRILDLTLAQRWPGVCSIKDLAIPSHLHRTEYFYKHKHDLIHTHVESNQNITHARFTHTRTHVHTLYVCTHDDGSTHLAYSTLYDDRRHSVGLQTSISITLWINRLWANEICWRGRTWAQRATGIRWDAFRDDETY